MTEEQVADLAIDAGRSAAAEKEYSRFDISNKVSWSIYTNNIRTAMDAVLGAYPDLDSFTNTDDAMKAFIAKEDGFEIGVFRKSTNEIVQSATIYFDSVDIVNGSSDEE